MHDGAAEPGLVESVRRVDNGVARSVSGRTVLPRAVPIRDQVAPAAEARPTDAEVRLLEQAYEDYYSL
jgi:hypothetical protein